MNINKLLWIFKLVADYCTFVQSSKYEYAVNASIDNNYIIIPLSIKIKTQPEEVWVGRRRLIRVLLEQNGWTWIVLHSQQHLKYPIIT